MCLTVVKTLLIAYVSKEIQAVAYNGQNILFLNHARF